MCKISCIMHNLFKRSLNHIYAKSLYLYNFADLYAFAFKFNHKPRWLRLIHFKLCTKTLLGDVMKELSVISSLLL